ncbi:MAG: DUF5655 domain-containing protein [Clostridia bacterium]|nr:DUF5655 domain-containing protein [Clostridia bacterium]
MDAEILYFFNKHMDALPLYQRLEALILEQIPDVRIKVSKTQIGFFNKRGFAFVSFNPCRRAKDRPETWVTVTFGLAIRVDDPRIDVATEPYPNRWTHHVTVSRAEDMDGQLLGWIREAAAFSASKR